MQLIAVIGFTELTSGFEWRGRSGSALAGQRNCWGGSTMQRSAVGPGGLDGPDMRPPSLPVEVYDRPVHPT
jgi:hypothetical protein